MKCYPKYKSSQLGWVGEIPKHWEVIKFHYLSQESKRKNDDEVDREMLSLSSYTGVQVKQYEYENTKRSKEESLTYLVVEPNQLVVNPMWQIQRGIGISYLHGIVSPGYRVYYIDLERLISQYLHYLMRSDGYVDEYNKHIRGLTTYDRSVKKEDFEKIGVLLPSKQEQTQIANFLDQKTGQIDELICIKERRIELLQEQRTALINQAVTKGLDPNVEMKPSEVEWIGEIPKHWTITRLKYLGESIIGLSYKPEHVTDDKNGTLVLRASNIQNGKPSFLDNVYVNAEVDEKLHLKEDDILICSRSGSRELIGKNITITKELEGVTFGVFMTIFRTKFFRFISYFLNSQVFKNQSGLFLTSTINQLTINTLNNFLISFPTDEREQAQIADFLNRKTRQIDELIAAEGQKIELLKEYRQSLISEVVTGKIDVRSEV